MKDIMNTCSSRGTASLNTSNLDIRVIKNYVLNIINTIFSISISPHTLLSCSIRHDNTKNHNGILSHLRKILLPVQELLPEKNDHALINIYEKGRRIMYARDEIVQERISSSRPLASLSLSPKIALIGALLITGSATAASTISTRRFTGPFSSHPRYNNSTHNSHHIYDSGSNISDEKSYRNDIIYGLNRYNSNIHSQTLNNEKTTRIRRDLLKPHHRRKIFSELALFKPETINNHKKNVHSIIKNTSIPNKILLVIKDKNIDWRARDELYLMTKLAERSDDIKRIRSPKNRNIMLLVKCIQFTKEFLFDKSKYILHEEAYRFRKTIMRRLLHILNNICTNDKIKAWQLLVYNNIITDKLPIQKLTIKSISEKNGDEHRNHSSADSFSQHKYKTKNDFLPPFIKRGNIKTDHQLNYIGREEDPGENVKNKNYNTVDDIKMESLYKCRDERENINKTDILRIISRTMVNPISEVINEGLIVYNYDYLGEGCKNNQELYESFKKIEDVINNFLSFNPRYGELRSGIMIIAGLIDLMADDLEDKKLSFLNRVETINSDIRSLLKGFISSMTSDQLSNLKDSPDTLKTMLEKLAFKQGVLNVKTETPPELVEVKETYNHFTNKKNGDFIFLNDKNNWIVNTKLTHIIKNSLDKARTTFTGDEDIISVKNSSPNFYQDAIILNDGKQLFVLIDNEFRPTKEIKFNDNDYRYLTSINTHDQERNIFTPVIFKGGIWCTEDTTSHAVSKEFFKLIEDNEIVINKLVSKHVTHSDVSPLTLGRDIQTDKYNNSYIKIADRYFMLKINNAGSIYIDGELDILLLTKRKDYYYPRDNAQDGLLAISRTELTSPIKSAPDKKTFLDNSVILAMGKHDFWDSGNVGRKIDNSIHSRLSSSTKIEGAVHLENEDYISYHDHLIKITNNGDDTFTLKSASGMDKEIIIYKNVKSNTYYLLADKKRFNRIKSHCLSKRQVLNICDVIHHETPNLNSLLKTNSKYAVEILNPEEILTPSGLVSSIYKNKNNDLFYYFQENKYFHCIEETDQQLHLTPAFFTIYGKRENGDIDLSKFISTVSVIKDFDTKEVIMSTPLEAQELVFNMDKKTSQILLEWQESNFHGDEITLNDLNKLPETLAKYYGFSDVQELILHGGKKNIHSLEYVNSRIDYNINVIKSGYDDINLLSLETISRELRPEHIAEIYDTAFTRAFLTLQQAILKITTHRASMYEYIINKLAITDVRARFFFINGIEKKLSRISMILNEKDMSNIHILVGKHQEPMNYQMPMTIPDGVTLGFTPCDDPLDRIIINALYIHQDFDPTTHPEQGFQQQEYFINIASETMLHEAVHATGTPEDYIYITSNEIGRLESIEMSLDQIDIAIRSNKMREEFYYLSKIYFSTNPVYHRYNIDDLMLPRNLHSIYKKDNYFNALLLLNNPDTLTIIIKDLARLA